MLDIDQLITSIKQRKTEGGGVAAAAAAAGQQGEAPSGSILSKISSGWRTFKEQEGLEDELQQAHKDGYLERQEFLARTDVRQFEREREIRQREREKRWMREQKAQSEKR